MEVADAVLLSGQPQKPLRYRRDPASRWWFEDDVMMNQTTALITGAAHGIGAACIQDLAAQGIRHFILLDKIRRRWKC